MMLAGLDVQLLCHYCFNGRHQSCFGQTLLDSIELGRRWHKCECGCRR